MKAWDKIEGINFTFQQALEASRQVDFIILE